MLLLLQRCLERDEPTTWADFWLLYFEVALPPVRRVLSCGGCGPADIDDVVMETCLAMCHNQFRRLREFRGESLPELTVRLISWLRIRRAIGCAPTGVVEAASAKSFPTIWRSPIRAMRRPSSA